MITTLRASLSHPPGKNEAYGYTRARPGPYLTRAARGWKDDAITILRAQYRWPVFPPIVGAGAYAVVMEVHFYTTGYDVDAPMLLTLDAVKKALLIDDAHFIHCPPTKVLVESKKDQRIDLLCDVIKLPSKKAAVLLARDICYAQLAHNYIKDKFLALEQSEEEAS